MASKTTRVMRNSDYLLRSTPEPACLCTWEKKESAVTELDIYIQQPARYSEHHRWSVQKHLVPLPLWYRFSWSNLCFNCSICWEVHFVSGTNNSWISILVKMYSLDLFSCKAQPISFLWEISVLHKKCLWKSNSNITPNKIPQTKPKTNEVTLPASSWLAYGFPWHFLCCSFNGSVSDDVEFLVFGFDS